MRKMVMTYVVTSVLLIGGQAIACEKTLPDDISAIEIRSQPFLNTINISVDKLDRELKVNYEVKGSDVYIECMIEDFQLTKENVGKRHKDGEGHIRLYVNDQKVDTLYQPAFIVKGLPTGKHHIKLEILQNDRNPYELEEEFAVQVP